MSEAQAQGTRPRREPLYKVRDVTMGVSAEERDRAEAYLDRIRMIPGGVAAMARDLELSASSIGNWPYVPPKHVKLVVAYGDSLMPAFEPQTKGWGGARRTARIVEKEWHRQCMACREPFTADSPYLRLCLTHRVCS